MGNLTVTTYAILRIKLQVETAKSSQAKARYVGCATCVLTRGVSLFIVLAKALGRASLET